MLSRARRGDLFRFVGVRPFHYCSLLSHASRDRWGRVSCRVHQWQHMGIMDDMRGPYDAAFYAAQKDGSRRSAERVLPFLDRWVRPKSVVDVGCGVGTWLSVWRELGVSSVVGVDGDYVDRSLLMIEKGSFIAHDLSRPIPDLGGFDLVMSLEVAEHLPAESAAQFVAGLTSLGPVVMFSAAIPSQGGTNHVNEQWPEYWARLFANYGYDVMDCLRREIWNDEGVEWWYAQNTFLYVRRGDLSKYPELMARCGGDPLARVHPRMWMDVVQYALNDPRRFTLRQHLGAIPGALTEAIGFRLKRALARRQGVLIGSPSSPSDGRPRDRREGVPSDNV